MIKKNIVTALCVTACANLVHAAYNPFKPDAIKVTNTAVVNINVNGGAQFNNLNTTPVVNTDTDANVFLSVTSNGVFCVPGTYLVDVSLYQTATVDDVNTAVEIRVNSVGTGHPGQTSFIDNASGSREATTNVSEIIRLTSTSKIGFMTSRLANAGNVATAVGQSAFRITRFKD
jgi:hypothetical protein